MRSETTGAEIDALAKLLIKVAGKEMETGITFVLAQTHEARLKAVRKAVDFACNKLVKHRDKKQDDTEDGLTIQICDMLTSSGIDATHNASIGGHCDIVVKEKDDFLWLAEAKKHNDYAWLDKGFQQLATRYSTGNPGQDHGDILIYCFAMDAKKMLGKWEEELKSRNSTVKTSACASGDPLSFDSVHKHDTSGLDFFTRHKVISMFWDPKDKK
ncbi:hypothetical protein J2766_005427 [Agrobacterium tumefaciens]|uniref:Restriction endonuclease n=1 Tax=Agrobacterium tumefaciens TaxID=358 RepID=A0AAW8M3E6_AGRTU|nr:hypothetical protein [Agrobacterium tumefaciens]MBP2568816.1 hypothetical protein [Agrobacterium tumefaciens]MDR6705611.1 hypothetical protein [Agrobacterium tumefaciens]